MREYLLVNFNVTNGITENPRYKKYDTMQYWTWFVIEHKTKGMNFIIY